MRKLLLFFSCITFHAFAQPDRDAFQLRYGTSPVHVNGDRDAIRTVDMHLRFPLLMKDSSLLAGGVGYEAMWTRRYPLFGKENVQGVSGQLVFNRNLRPGHSVLAFTTVGIYSDFADISGEDVRYMLGFRYKTKLHEKFSLSYGIGLSKQFFGVLVAPFVDFDWKINNRFRLSGPFPLNTRLRYVPTRKVELSVFLKPDNATFRLSERDYQSRYFQRKQWNLGVSMEYRWLRHWQLAVRTGYTARRKFQTFEASQTGVLSILTFDVKGRKRTPYSQYEENAYFAEVSVAWVIGKEQQVE